MKWILGIALVFFNSSAFGDECMDTAMTQSEINMCSAEKAKNAQYQLNKLERDILETLNSTQKEKLNKAQVNWRSMMEHDCQLESSFFEGGSIRPTIFNACIESHHNERIEQIKYYLCPSWAMKGKCDVAKEY